MTLLHALATLLPKFKRSRSIIFSNTFKPATKGHTLVYVRQAFLTPLFCFILFGNAYAQPGQIVGADARFTDIKPLQIGDTVPEELWHTPLQVVNHRNGKDAITLNDYRGTKLIILDFWATWCGSCIKNFPKMDSLNTLLQPQVQILLVNSIAGTGDTHEKVKTFFENLDYSISIPTVTNDSLFKMIFPRKFIPHYVWLNDKGKVRAITASKELTLDNIKLMLHDDKTVLKTKEY